MSHLEESPPLITDPGKPSCKGIKKVSCGCFNSFPGTGLAATFSAIWESGMCWTQHTQLWRGAAGITCDGDPWHNPAVLPSTYPQSTLRGTAHQLSKTLLLLFLQDIMCFSLRFPIYALQPFPCAGPSLLSCRHTGTGHSENRINGRLFVCTHWREYSPGTYFIQSSFKLL